MVCWRQAIGQNARLPANIRCALVRGSKVLLLDESTSHLDPETAAGIERLVMGLDGVSVILVSHNATETAKQLSDRTLVMADGRLTDQ